MRRKRDWPALIEDHEKSGMTVAAFCRAREINPNLFYRHRRQRGDQSRFVEVAARPVNANPEPIMLSVSGHSLSISPGFDPDTLKAVLRVLAEV